MKTHRSFMFIRDGVLVNRMNINPVAFAVAISLFNDAKQFEIETVINFGFEKSGYSAADKMRMFVDTHQLPSIDFVAATALYNDIASEAATGCRYFDGMPNLLAKLRSAGNCSYITSAVEQHVLDGWLKTAQGQEISSSLTEVLGAGTTMTKGRGHFKYVSSRDRQPIVMVADAPSEIAMAKEFAKEFDITAVAFGYRVTPENVSLAFDQLKSLLGQRGDARASKLPQRIDRNKLNLPPQDEVETTLELAGADCVVAGDEQTIVRNLERTLVGLTL